MDFEFEDFSCTFRVELNFRVILFGETTRYNNVVGVDWREKWNSYVALLTKVKSIGGGGDNAEFLTLALGPKVL